MSSRVKRMLELAAKKLTECQERENIDDEEPQEVINIEQQKNLQFIEETGHTVLETNDDSATSAAECKSDVHLSKRNRPSVQYFEDDSSENFPCRPIFDSDDSDKDKTYMESSSKDDSSTDSWESENSDAIFKVFSDSEVTETPSMCGSVNVTPNMSGSITPKSISNSVSTSTWSNITTETCPFDLFTKNPTLNINSNIVKSPLEIFEMFIDDEILDLIVRETNTYACQQLKKGHSAKSRVQTWCETSKEEIRKFFGVLLAMGLISAPSVSNYWSKDPIFHNEFISSVMARDRFFLLLKFIHFADNERAETTNRLYKIENLLCMVLKKYNKILQPGRHLVIDESMVPYRGRLHFRQYIPTKSHKYGIKLYKLCSTDGYTCNIIVYAGKGTTNENLGHSQSVVVKLLEVINPKEGRILYADNFYSSISLVRNLFEMKILYCGTLRSNRRGVPKDIGTKMKKGEVVGIEQDGVKIIKWVDKRPVLMITSDPRHTSALLKTGKHNRSGEEIHKPKCVIDYNMAKKGVDLSDQMSSYHTSVRKSVKWYRKVMFEVLLGTTVVNAWIVYNMISSTKLGITEFRKHLAETIIVTKTPAEKIPLRKRVHTFVKPEGAGRKKRKVCRGCYMELRKSMTSREADKKVRRVISFCSDCPDSPGFCLACFNKHHS